MTSKIGFIVDPLETFKIAKDSSFAMMLAAQARGWEVYTLQQSDLYYSDGELVAQARLTRVEDSGDSSFDNGPATRMPVTSFDALLMRKDPPFDMEYIFTTYLLSLAAAAGVLVVNSPSSLRNANEKMFITEFPQCCTEMAIGRDPRILRDFVTDHDDVILKPLDGMGGESIFRVSPDDPNLSVIIETISRRGQRTVMAQRYIPAIRESGDKRILLVDGEPIPYALARMPADGETRGNLAAGGSGVGVELTERDRWICDQVGPRLREDGILFAGIDVIGDFLTEINITSPTCIRELDAQYGIDIAGQLMDTLATRIAD